MPEDLSKDGTVKVYVKLVGADIGSGSKYKNYKVSLVRYYKSLVVSFNFIGKVGYTNTSDIVIVDSHERNTVKLIELKWDYSGYWKNYKGNQKINVVLNPSPIGYGQETVEPKFDKAVLIGKYPGYMIENNYNNNLWVEKPIEVKIK